MNRVVGYLKIGALLLGIYTVFTREYLVLACKRLNHRRYVH